MSDPSATPTKYPARHLAVVTCMDTRIDVLASLGLAVGEAHIIRNAGGIVTDDVIRSLCLSQRSLGTTEVWVVHHSDCGLCRVDEAGFLAEVEADVGVRPTWAVEGFADAHDDVRQSMRRLDLSPFVNANRVRGFVYDVDRGELDEVSR